MTKLSINRTISKAKFFAKNGNIEEAKNLYRLILNTFPKNKRANEGLISLSKKSQNATTKSPDQKLISQLLGLYNQGEFASAIDRANVIIEKYPNEFVVWNILGASYRGLNLIIEASAAFKKVTVLNPSYADGFNNFGSSLYDQENIVEAILCYKKAISLKPDFVEAYYNMGTAYKAQGKLQEAMDAYAQALLLKPDYADVYNNMGNVLKEQGKLDEAIQAYTKVQQLKPEYAESYNNMGIALQYLGKLEEAIESFKKSISLNPESAEAFNNISNVFKEQGEFEKAIKTYEKALFLKPDYSEAYYNMGIVKHKFGRTMEATGLFSNALLMSPFNAKFALAKLCHTLPIVWNNEIEPNPLSIFDEALLNFTTWSKSDKAQQNLYNQNEIYQPFYLAYYPENMVQRLGQYGEIIEKLDFKKTVARKDHFKSKPINIGIITAHLKNHSVFNILIKGLILNLDRDDFSINIYCTDPNETIKYFRQEFIINSYFVINSYNGQDDFRNKVINDELDILLYPEIGMDPVTTWMASQRLVPIQIVWWGHPITSGLRTMDYYLSGELIEGLNANSHYKETLVTLPGTGCVTQFVKKELKKSDWEQQTFPNSNLNFIIPQNPFKFHPDNDKFILQIAREVPNAVFLLPSSSNYPNSIVQILDRLKLLFEKSGISFEGKFLIFPWLKSEEFLSLLQAADIYLDLPTFSGYTTAWQGVNCGIPIVTLEGDYMRQRLASGLLRKIKMTDTIAGTFDEYMKIIRRLVELHKNQTAWMEYRKKIKKAAPLADNDLSVIYALESFFTKCVELENNV